MQLEINEQLDMYSVEPDEMSENMVALFPMSSNIKVIVE